MDLQETKRGKVTLTDRKTLVIDGVQNVLNFDETYASVSTSLGEVGIEGEDLKIENLSKEKNEVTVCGKISAFYYKEKISKKKRG
ncbi:MAG: YabP/YqfC family sporulation protein [Clostridia bacterium]|nr:YabP/YqfC family sporulation protein [Clostridia bacterium]